MMRCANPDCGDNTLLTVFGANGLRTYCQKCGSAPVAPAPTPAPRAPEVPRPAAETVAKRPGGRVRGGSVLAMAKAEAAALKREIRQLEAKKRQLAELQRLIAAAKKPTNEGATVRQLKRA